MKFPTRKIRTRKVTEAPRFLPALMPVNAPIRRCPVSRERASHRILIMRTGGYGDILMGTPLLAALRQAYPEAHLTWLAEHSQLQAIDANPIIDECLRWDGGYWKRLVRKLHYHLWVARALRFRRELRERRFDIFISFQPEEWPLLIYGTGVPKSVGVFDTFRRYYRATRTSAYTRLYTHAYAHPALPDHRTDQYLLPLEALGLPQPDVKQMTMGFTAQDALVAGALLAENGIHDGDPFIVLAPMTTWPTKCWPLDRFAALGDALAARTGHRIVVTCAAREAEAVSQITAQMRHPPVLIAGELDFRQAAAVIARAALTVCGDTGPLHVSAAVGTPYVGIFGPTAPQWYAPLAGRGTILSHEVPCGPCDQKRCPIAGDGHMRCMRLITTPEVLAAAVALLGLPATAGRLQGERG